MNVTDQICKHVIASRYEDLGDFTISRVKTRILDSIGVIAAGVKAPMVAELLELLKSYGYSDQSSVLFHNQKMDSPSAAMMNSFAMRSFDFEAIEAENPGKKSSPAHISGTTIPTALACAERIRATGKELITALAVGDDITARLGMCSGFDIYGYWDSTNTINGLGAATIAGKLLGLNERELNNALGLELSMLGGSQDNITYKTLAFKYPMAFASRNAIFAADFAKAGMTASHDAIGGKKGYFPLFTGDRGTPELLTVDLGKVFYGDVIIKPWAACRATHATIDAVLRIVQANEFDVGEIEKIYLNTNQRTANGFVGQPWEMKENAQVCGAFSIIYTAACAALFKSVRPEHMSIDVMESSAIKSLTGKIEIVPSLPDDAYQTASAKIVLTNGEEFESYCDCPKGNIYYSPMTEEEILDKFYKNIEFSGVASKENAAKCVELVSKLEELEDINELIQLIA